MSTLETLTVGDLILALSKLPQDTKLKHYYINGLFDIDERDFRESNQLMFIERHGDEVWLCFEYDSGKSGEDLDFAKL